MSGPKVLTIVTREELIAIGEGHIAMLEAMLRQWQRFGERNGVVDARDIELARARVRAMRGLLARDKFKEVQDRVPAELSFLKADMERRMQASVDLAAVAKKRERQLIRSAEAIAKSLRERGLTVPNELAAPKKQSKEALQKAIGAGFAALTPAATDRGVSDRQRELAASLGSGEERMTLAAWLERQARDFQDDPLVVSLERKVDELQAFDPDAAVAFRGRLGAIAADRGPRRNLLADSLLIELSAARRDSVRRMEIRTELEGVRAELETLSGDVAMAQAQGIAETLGRETETATLGASLEIAKKTLEEARSVQAQHLRRRALLEGLAEIGYELESGMETAWVENGRVVLRNSQSPLYGVELGGSAENQIQVRTVAFDSANVRDRTLDISAETEFCGHFESLKDTLSKAGTAISVVKALGVGTTPVKCVPAPVIEAQTVILARSLAAQRRKS
jgi:hypothetical protein